MQISRPFAVATAVAIALAVAGACFLLWGRPTEDNRDPRRGPVYMGEDRKMTKECHGTSLVYVREGRTVSTLKNTWECQS